MIRAGLVSRHERKKERKQQQTKQTQLTNTYVPTVAFNDAIPLDCTAGCAAAAAAAGCCYSVYYLPRVHS